MVTKSTVRVNPKVKTLAEAFELQPAEMKRITIQVDYAFRAQEKKVFASSGSAGGSKFAPLSARYAKWKKRNYPGRKILSLTGGLRKSLSTKTSGHVARSTTTPRATITVGTRNILAAYHGPGQLHNPRMPERDALQHRPQDEQKYIDIAAEYFLKVKLPRVARTLAAWKAVRVG